jgi:hypothetical protein
MRRTLASTAAGLVLAAASAVVAPSAASAAAGPLAGVWTSIDTDGSHQTLVVTGAGQHAYSMVYTDDAATGACQGSPARLSGPGFVEGSHVHMQAALVCLPGGNEFRTRVSLDFTHDSVAGTLTDGFGIVWTRNG